MADPNPSIWNDDDSSEITAINFGTGDAGAYRELEAGKEYHIWNDKGAVLGSSDMTSVKITVRDSDGLEVENITVQKWVEVKSLTLHDGGGGAGVGSCVDDNMADFQPVGKDGYLNLGDIPSDCYRKVMIRINIPTSALETGTTFKIYVTNQQPSSPIAKWITGLWGDGVVDTGNKLEVTNPAGADSDITIASGYALINDMEVYLSAAQTYTISTTDATYKIYLTRAGVISSTIGAIPANSIQLASVVISGGVVTTVTDTRPFTGDVVKTTQVGVTAYATGGQANAIQITGDIVEISVCATDGDSIKLPTAIAGLEVTIVNHGVKSVDVFPYTGDYINSRAINTAKALANNEVMKCFAWNSSKWECMNLIGDSER